MRRDAASRTVAGWVLFGALAILSSGFTPEGRADHDAGERHVEVDHGGHGHALLEIEERLPSVASPMPVAMADTTVLLPPPPATSSAPTPNVAVIARGRDPPRQLGARAPPSLRS